MTNIPTLVINLMHSTDRKINQEDQEFNYSNNPLVQDPPNFFNKFLFFNRLSMLKQYITEIKKETIFNYDKRFQNVLSSNRILEKFAKSKRKNHPFDIFGEIFRMEKRGIIVLLVLSILAGLTSLVPIYFQFILVKAVMGDVQQYWSFAVVISVMFLRFLLLNYTLNLSSNISLNIKIYMQNTFMRAIFYCNKSSPSAKYLDVDIIGEGFYYIPYLITSQIIVIGTIVFTFLQVGVYGCIVLGIYIIMYISILICGKIAYNTMKQNNQRRFQREKLEKGSISGLMKIVLQRISDYIFRLTIVEKSLQTKQNLKITLLYILGQTFGECCVVFSNLTLYFLTKQHDLVFIQSYYSALFMVACFYPLRYSVYGFFTLVKSYEAYVRLDEQLKQINQINISALPPCDHQTHIFAENIGECFQYPYNKMEQEVLQSLKTQHKLADYIESQQKIKDELKEDNYILKQVCEGEILMVMTRINSQPSIFQCIDEFVKSKPANRSLAVISTNHFLLPLSLKDNILFYSPYSQERFKKILQITQLDCLGSAIWEEQNLTDERSLKFNQWHQTRIQLARALYNNVDYLIINKSNVFDDLSLLTAVFAQRRSKNKLTIVANNTHKFYFKLADRIIVLGTKGQIERGTYDQLKLKRESLFNQMFLKHHEKVDHSERVIEEKKTSSNGTLNLKYNKKRQCQFHLQKSTFFEFFNFVHRKAQIIIIIGLFLPVCFKYYLQYLIGKSSKEDIAWSYLIFGLIYLFLIFMRGFFLSFYTSFSSLSLYRKICRKLQRLNAHQLMEHFQRPKVDYDFHSRAIDRNLVMDFQYGQSILIEIIVSFIIYCTGQPVYIAVAIPVIAGIVFINGQYAKNARKIYLLKLKQTKGINLMITSSVEKKKQISNYLKVDDFNKEFYKENRVEIIYDSNIQWLETGLRTFAQLVVWISYIIFLLIMIKTIEKQQLYKSLVSLGSSMFINLMYLNTFYLKAFRQMEISLVSLTLCMNLLKSDPLPTPKQLLRVLQPEKIKIVQTVQKIQFKKVYFQYFRNVSDKISLIINAKDRIALSGNSNSHKQLIFYTLQNRLFDITQIKGEIIINGQIHKQFRIQGLYYLHANPILPYLGTVLDALQYQKNSLTEENLDRLLLEFFEIMDSLPTFKSSTLIEQLTVDQKELFQVFRVTMVEECRILIIVSGFDNIDIVSRRKLTKWILKQKKINIVIQITNIREMVQLYPKQYKFQQMKIKLVENNQSLSKHELILKRWESKNQERFERQQSIILDHKQEKSFDSMLRLEKQKENQNVIK